MSSQPATINIDLFQMQVDTLVGTYRRLNGIMQSQTSGISHEESLLQPPFRANCMNWVIGHIVQSRDIMLMVLNGEGQLSAEEAALYKRDSEPITDGAKALPLEHLLQLYQRSTERLIAMIIDASHEVLLTWHEETQSTILERLQSLVWHETYHIGQLEPLRQLAGKNDKII
jgi:uncharacterized damage-inducible protein DinB